ncbi:radical SAM protein [Streptosporangium sp. NPDC023825]|uniref:radical SAM protein n=1 Tax=Streptosporangium sp. NPDC023825 TaxID=3154909 RepID=UPI00344880FC
MLRLGEIDALRRQRGRSALLLITDRCPVGCAHCSVDSRTDGPRITDHALFEEMVEGLCADEDLRVVGVSGGEPFTERRGLTYAARRIHESGKALVPYTSGHWGAGGDPPGWIRSVLGMSACVVLGVDAHHTSPRAAVAAAARAVADAGAWLVAQVLDDPAQIEDARDLLEGALGAGWPDRAEIHPVAPLPYGRARGLFPAPRRVTGERLGRCAIAHTPTVRYDGRISACCDENVIMGAGPPDLHRLAGDREGVRRALADLVADPFLAVLGSLGTGALTALPRYRDLARREFSGICGICRHMLRRAGGERDPLLRALALIPPPGPPEAAPAGSPEASPGTPPAGEVRVVPPGPPGPRREGGPSAEQGPA